MSKLNVGNVAAVRPARKSAPLLSRIADEADAPPMVNCSVLAITGQPFSGTEGPEAGGTPLVGIQFPKSRMSTFRFASHAAPAGPKLLIMDGGPAKTGASRRDVERGASLEKTGPIVPTTRPYVKFRSFEFG